MKPSRAKPIPLAIAKILVQDLMTALQSPLAFLNAATAAARNMTATASRDRSRMLTSIETSALESSVPRDADAEVDEGLRKCRKENSLLKTSLSSWKTGELENKVDEEDCS